MCVETARAKDAMTALTTATITSGIFTSIARDVVPCAVVEKCASSSCSVQTVKGPCVGSVGKVKDAKAVDIQCVIPVPMMSTIVKFVQ